MMKTVKVGNRSVSMKRVRTFSPAKEGFDQARLAQKYPKAMAALTILTLAHQANPLKALLAIGSGKRQYDERTTEKFLADAEKFISSFDSMSRSFSEIKSDDEFRKYAHNVMKEAHGDEYSEEITNKVVDDLLKNNKGADYGELIGRLTSGLGE